MPSAITPGKAGKLWQKMLTRATVRCLISAREGVVSGRLGVCCEHRLRYSRAHSADVSAKTSRGFIVHRGGKEPSDEIRPSWKSVAAFLRCSAGKRASSVKVGAASSLSGKNETDNEFPP